MSKVTIIDYGVGNLLSVKRAFEYCGAEVTLTDSIEVIQKAERLILPGVGAFADGMAGLKDRNLIEAIKSYALQNRPFMGICLGMQMMLEVGEEFGLHAGLGIVSGRVIPIPDKGLDGVKHKIPHIGWAELTPTTREQIWDNTILDSISHGESVYFVHSFMAMPCRQEHSLASYFYNGNEICAVIKAGNLYGCQFHPEKSGNVGMSIIKNFLTI